jgi:hypothetical protein
MSNISLVSVSMDRHENIIASLHSWLDQKQSLYFDEIIIVDWCSKQDLLSMIPSYLKNNINYNKVKIHTVRGFDKWVLTWAFNFALSLATCDIVLKLDADVILFNNFLGSFQLTENNFISGNLTLSGSFIIYRKNLVPYNEMIQSYGCGDNDLYERLIASGLKQEYFNISMMESGVSTNSNVLSQDPYQYNPNRVKKISDNMYTIIDCDMKNSDIINVTNNLELDTKNVFIEVRNGTCNRLRTLISAVLFSRICKYKLFVVWRQTNGYNDSDFMDYFDYAGVNEITFIRDVPNNIMFDCTYYNKRDNYIITNDMLDKIKNLYIRTGSTLNAILEPLNLPNYNQLYMEEVAKIKPNIKVNTIMNYVVSYYNIPSNYTSVHIRRGDALLAPNIAQHYMVSSIEKFADIINLEWETSQQKIIVITDDREYVEEQFAILCPNRYIVISEPYEKPDRANPIKHYIMKDVVDLFILANSMTIYGTNFSSYSHFASLLVKKSKLIIVKDSTCNS